MKKSLLKSFMGIALVVLLFGCNSGGEDPAPPTPPASSLEISPATIDFVADGAAQTITITSNGDWTISSDKDWCVLSVKSGKGNATVTVTPSKNVDLDVRNAVITAKQETITKTSTIRQLGEAPAILVSPEKLFVPANGGDVDLKITTNIEYDVVLPGAWVTEYTATLSKTMVTYDCKFKVEAYSDIAIPRFGKLVIKQKGSDLQKEVGLTQLTAEPAETVDMYVKEDEQIPTAGIDAGGGVVNVLPSGHVEESVATESWIEIIPNESPASVAMRTKAAPGAVTIVLQPNEGDSRSGFAIFKITGGTSDTVQFKQIGTAPSIVVDKELVALQQVAGTFNLEIITNADVEFAVTSNKDWLTVPKVETETSKATSEMKKTKIAITYSENKEVADREGVVTFKQKGGDLEATVKVKQKGFGEKSMVLLTKELVAPANENVIVAEVFFAAGTRDCSIDIKADWITQIGEMPGRGFNFTVAENKTGSERIGKIIFSQVGSTAKDSMIVKQLIAVEDKYNRHTDSLALVQFFKAFGSVDHNYVWPQGYPINQLGGYGIQTDNISGQVRVVQIALRIYIPQPFDIPEEIWTLSQMRYLSLDIPVNVKLSDKIGCMTNVEVISLPQAVVSGEIPSSIGQLKRLTKLELLGYGETGGFTSIPDEIVNMESLRDLNLSISMDRIPDNICNKLNLTRLTIKQIGRLSQDFIPSSISSLQNLQVISISSTERNGCLLPEGLFLLPNLMSATVEVSGPVSANVSGSKLVELLVSGPLTKLFPDGVRVPQTVRFMGLESPNMTEIPDELVSSNLESLQLVTPKVAKISPLFAKLPRLTQLNYIGGIDMDDPLAELNPEIYNMKSLKQILIRNVKGTLDDRITNLTNLTHLQINNSSMDGKISDKMWQFFLDNLGRPLPTQNGTFRLMITDNRFTGIVPDFILQSDSWTKEIYPSEGSWYPNQNIIRQQPGYGFENLKNSSPSKMFRKERPRKNADGRYEMLKVQ